MAEMKHFPSKQLKIPIFQCFIYRRKTCSLIVSIVNTGTQHKGPTRSIALFTTVDAFLSQSFKLQLNWDKSDGNFSSLVYLFKCIFQLLFQAENLAFLRFVVEGEKSSDLTLKYIETSPRSQYIFNHMRTIAMPQNQSKSN